MKLGEVMLVLAIVVSVAGMAYCLFRIVSGPNLQSCRSFCAVNGLYARWSCEHSDMVACLCYEEPSK